MLPWMAWRALATLLTAAAVSGPAAGQEAHQHLDGRLGTVTFSNSCSATVQPAFARGMALLHSFEFGPAIDAFSDVAAADPSCGIALWGIGLAQWGNPFSPANRPAAQLQAGRTTAGRAASAGAKTRRERDDIAALAALYDRDESVDQRSRVIAYRDAMQRLSRAYPEDTEAQAFYGLALAAAADPADKSYADQLKAGAILEQLWAAQPDHPGLAHYIIHTYDAPALATRAVEAARRYAKIAPDAPHALHMPSHTFTRLGYWQDSIETNILSAASAKKHGQVYEALHATDYEIYACLQTAQDAKARTLVDEASRLAGATNQTAGAAPPVAGAYAVAAIPARYALERGAWADAARLQLNVSGVPYAEAVTWFARGLGLTRGGRVQGVNEVIDQLQTRAGALDKAGEAYWAEQVKIQALVVTAWQALVEGHVESGLASMRQAADREDQTEKAAISPGPLAPARELLAEMLLQLGRPRQALAEFRRTMAKEPNRFRSLAGAAAAAERSGHPEAARDFRRRLASICERGDTPGRSDLQRARAAR